MSAKIRSGRVLLVALLISRIAFAGDTTLPTRLTLSNGSNEVRVHDIKILVIKALVSTGNAHSFETYTSFTVPSDPHEDWQQILVDNPDGDAESFRSIESADSNVQSVAMVRENDTLSVVQARKIGLKPPDLYLKNARVTFTVYRFNGDTRDYPRFVRERTGISAETYLNASDALDKEFLRR
ncbi:hypothetical protein [Paraburkholderia hospita]|jgi:hypothetical protein|uniref:Uncharacterized protein n=1 Tax=Paraburkholderia hospita TaxID=169430 RepID=A0ABP2Q0J1_9BURK|nr:hypothetical protein [Paraburkholderia hospita]EIN02169.1 hypothetical protein WQE_05322 [Paraburkholderia hospita]OUL82716.1 hypothetical protein CA602_23705 [Paraburkholderia hospita]OUL82770.1 hypothetical protein CA601_28735 [Paraburkholderia hospita]SEH52600.1 hypothetical protein SAMN05192544_100382 [Paraburkholderia hospita]